jgi:hypothetical protein
MASCAKLWQPRSGCYFPSVKNSLDLLNGVVSDKINDQARSTSSNSGFGPRRERPPLRQDVNGKSLMLRARGTLKARCIELLPIEWQHYDELFRRTAEVRLSFIPRVGSSVLRP